MHEIADMSLCSFVKGKRKRLRERYVSQKLHFKTCTQHSNICMLKYVVQRLNPDVCIPEFVSQMLARDHFDLNICIPVSLTRYISPCTLVDIPKFCSRYICFGITTRKPVPQRLHVDVSIPVFIFICIPVFPFRHL